MKSPTIAVIVSSVLAAAGAAAAQAQSGSESGRIDTQALGEVIVTAQKREQSINDVPVSMTVASGSKLLELGITSTADLAKVVPGLTYQPSPLNTPIYTLRGVGFFEFSLAATPTVAIYTDEVPLPFGAMTKAAGLDLERVEVLKGPQGTLFGQNTTGGAINFIAAKPTDTFKTGADLSYGRFDSVDLQGFVSGPVSDSLNARVSLRSVTGGDWQKNPFRQDSLGARREYQGRVLLDWKPNDKLSMLFNLNGWIDKSDSQAPQRTEVFVSAPGNPNEAPIRALLPVPLNARSADWTNNVLPLKHDDWFLQTALRADYEISDNVVLTSITAFEKYSTDSFQDYDGTTLQIADTVSRGRVETISQELRLTGKNGSINWVVGGNYEHDKTEDAFMFFPDDSTTNYVGTLRGGPVVAFANRRIKTAAAFANVDWEIMDRVSIVGGVRYTDRRDKRLGGCNLETPAPPFENLVNEVGGFAEIFEFLQTLIHPGNVVPIGAGDCITFDPNFFPLIDDAKGSLNEDNLSWRGGINYKTQSDGLLYANISKGYKAGAFPTVAAGTLRELDPVKQESILAYEAGFKLPFAGQRVQLNGAVFLYDYKDKQLRGRVLNPVFGPLDALVQVPKSKVKGAELQVIAEPVDGLSLNVAATYLDTKITDFIGFNQTGQLADFSGFRFPFSPKWSVISDAQYEWGVNSNLKAFIGASSTSNSATTASIGDISQLQIRSYTLVDARAGIKSADDRWRLSVWGRNIFNKYYWNSANQSQDVFVRFTARPVTYGISVSYRMQ
ncbi:MAG: TonB-dependent receptor [Dehalococcoidia bacterium]